MKNSKKVTLGIELPFGFCLVKSQNLRDLQNRCRQAEFSAFWSQPRLYRKKFG